MWTKLLRSLHFAIMSHAGAGVRSMRLIKNTTVPVHAALCRHQKMARTQVFIFMYVQFYQLNFISSDINNIDTIQRCTNEDEETSYYTLDLR